MALKGQKENEEETKHHCHQYFILSDSWAIKWITMIISYDIKLMKYYLMEHYIIDIISLIFYVTVHVLFNMSYGNQRNLIREKD